MFRLVSNVIGFKRIKYKIKVITEYFVTINIVHYFTVIIPVRKNPYANLFITNPTQFVLEANSMHTVTK
jgi:hypothetical protein